MIDVTAIQVGTYVSQLQVLIWLAGTPGFSVLDMIEPVPITRQALNSAHKMHTCTYINTYFAGIPRP